MTTPRSLSLNDLSWVDVQSHLARDSRLIVPVGACDQYGPHLPIGATTLVAEAVAAALSEDQGVLRAPALPYGVAQPTERLLPGATSLHEKTLHRVLNDLIACWVDEGFTEFVLLTAQSHDPHVEALASVSTSQARVRVVELLGIDFSAELDGPAGPQHAGEVLTSLMLYLHPDKVNLSRVEDFPPERLPGRLGRRLAALPAAAQGVLGTPSLASADKGARIFQGMVERIRDKVFVDPAEP